MDKDTFLSVTTALEALARRSAGAVAARSAEQTAKT